MKYSLIKACSDLGVHVNGSCDGPNKIVESLNKNDKINNIYTINKNNIIKSLDKNDKAKNLDAVNKFNESLYNQVKEVINSGDFPVTLGGDHSVVIASALASIICNENLGIIWIDSHGDYNNFSTTISGNLHGLPFAAITGYEDTEKLTLFHNKEYFKFKNAVLVGARDIDPLEIINLEKAGIKIFTTDDIKKYGASYIMEKAFEIASNNTNGIHISYDLDVIDPIIAPGVSIKAVDGINIAEANEIMDKIVEHKNIVRSLDLVEFNPKYDIDNKTLDIAINLLKMFIK